MKAVEVAPGVHQVLKGFVGAYVIESDDGLVLFDCGVPKKADAISEAIRGMGRTIDEVNHILITHHHPDHVGSLPDLAKRSQAKVYVHAVDAPVVRGEAKLTYPTPDNPIVRLLSKVAAQAPDIEPTTVDHEPVDGEVLPLAGGIRVVHTPGHTLGHVSYLIEREPRTLVVGDAALDVLFGVMPSTGTLAQISTFDQALAAESFKNLAALEFDAAVFGHGRAIPAGAAAKFRQRAARVK